MTNAEDRLPIEDLFSEKYDRDELAAYQRMTAQAQVSPTPLLDSVGGSPPRIGQAPAPEAPVAAPTAVSVDLSPESLARSADMGAQIPQPQLREKLTNQLKEPSVRGAVNTILSTVTGGVLTLDEIDEHLRAMAEHRPSPLEEKLKSREALKLLDPIGNTAEAVTREQLRREGTLPPELQDKVASTVGLLAGLLTPAGVGKKASKVGTEVLMNSMFSNPATHAANIASNALTSAWAIPERFLSATASALEYGVTLGKHERQVFFGESGAMLVGAVSSLVDAIKEAGIALRTGESRLPSIMEDVAQRSTLSGERPRLRFGPEGLKPIDKALADDTVLGQGMGFWSALWRMPTRALGAEDVAFKTINRQMEIYAQAYREAARTGDLSFSSLRKLIENPDPIVAMRADQFATIHTFQRSLDELGPIFEKAGAAGQSIADISLGVIPLGRLVVPVIRTPTNLAHFALERTPILNMLSSTWRSDIAAGGALRATALGKLGGGATMAAAMMYFGNGGIITGGGPVDRNLRRNKEELEGWQPYSIRIGDTWYAYDRLSPMGSMLGIVADAAEIGGSLQSYKMSELAQAITLAATRNLTSKTFLEGAADFFSAATGDEAALGRLSKSMLSALTPGAARALKKAMDPIRRETNPGADPEEGVWSEVRGYLNQIKAQTPGWSTSLPPRRNLWGDPIEIPSGWGPDWLSPVYTSIKKNDPAGDEIVRLGKTGLLSVGRAPRVILGSDPDSHPIGQPASPMDTGIELTDSEYDSFVRLAGNAFKDPQTKLGMHDALNQMVLTDERYKTASDAMRATIITNTVNAYRKAATVELLATNGGLMEAYKARVQNKGDALMAPQGTFKPQLTTPR